METAIEATKRSVGKKFKKSWGEDDGNPRHVYKKQRTNRVGIKTKKQRTDRVGIGRRKQRTDSVGIETKKQRNNRVGIEIEQLDEDQKAAKEQKELFEAKKLSLVLDLDHTLLQSAAFEEISRVEDQQMLKNKMKKDRKKAERRDLFCHMYLGRWIKLRPGIWNFLEEASKLYKLHICTMGHTNYAKATAKLLDPTGELFEGRVISTFGNKHKDLNGVLGMKSTAIIIDDTVSVWPHHTENLILVDRYKYFPYGTQHLGIPRNEQTDGVLDSSLKQIERIHSTFFSNPLSLLNEMDVTSILAAEKCKVLAGCHVQFTAHVIVPEWMDNPEKHPLWQTALQLGATCTTEKEACVTHVVSNRNGTGRVKGALATGRFAVSTRWIEAAAFLLRKPNESDFVIT
ncbi:protein-serine/threonine phosphatase [Ranunculus cassubicifolius]